jgi:hypothetical protein
VPVRLRCWKNSARVRKAARAAKGIPTASPTVRAGSAQDTDAAAAVVDVEVADVLDEVEDVVDVDETGLVEEKEGVKGVPASKVKFVLHMFSVNWPEPEQVKKRLLSPLGQRLMLLNAPRFTKLHVSFHATKYNRMYCKLGRVPSTQRCGHATAFQLWSVHPPRYITPAFP